MVFWAHLIHPKNNTATTSSNRTIYLSFKTEIIRKRLQWLSFTAVLHVLCSDLYLAVLFYFGLA